MAKKPITHPNLFDYLDQINLKGKKYEYDKKVASAYILSLWLSHDSGLIGMVQKMNFIHFTLPDSLIYDYYFDMVPKKKRFIRWTKKEVISKKEEKEIESLQEQYGISKKEAKMYMKSVK